MLERTKRRVQQTISEYPRQFWLIFWGMLINAAGASMVWPFLTIYLRQRLDISLTSVALLLTVNSVSGLVATSLGGPAVDRFGRKGAMFVSLIVGGVTRLAMSSANTIPNWVILMVVSGAFKPFLRIGGNAMVADLVVPERRAGAYALLRMITNLGIAIGPAVGGFVTNLSYTYAFYIAGVAHILYALLILFLVKETVPRQEEPDSSKPQAGFGPVLRDRAFMIFCGVFTVASMAAPLMMILLPVYAKENFGVPERHYGFIMATNAAMVVFFQYVITRKTQRYPALFVMILGTLFYAFGVGSVALGRGFLTFMISMIILTIGEMLLVPTGTALTANLAPADMRGRYLGMYNLTWGIARGIAPVIGGFMNDNFSPVSIWYGGFGIGLLGVLGFILLKRSGLFREKASWKVLN